ncbi:CC_3452 family protein [Sphingomonas sp. PB4P5]|uniref:CC_3452 family protein n=1 Tax=Parasphingomonas puruogangriensis TaxID=3096155 RepID=UPI002FC8285B
MTRSIAFVTAFAASSLFASAAGAGYYSATPVAAPAKPSLIAGSMMWKCDGGVCSAPKATSRDAIVCEQVVKRIGTVSTFSANGAAFDEAALAKCNARAK